VPASDNLQFGIEIVVTFSYSKYNNSSYKTSSVTTLFENILTFGGLFLSIVKTPLKTISSLGFSTYY